MGLALASAALSVLLYIEPCGRRRHEIINKLVPVLTADARRRQKDDFDTHNITTVVNVTSFENVSVLENVQRGR